MSFTGSWKCVAAPALLKALIFFFDRIEFIK
jgi:hypothetical protein